jgi:hypothetical protein
MRFLSQVTSYRKRVSQRHCQLLILYSIGDELMIMEHCLKLMSKRYSSPCQRYEGVQEQKYCSTLSYPWHYNEVCG